MQDPALAKQIALAALPAGPVRRLGPHYVSGVYAVWKFAHNQELAKQFLVDLALNYREAFVRSEFYNLPAFPGAVPDLGDLVASDSRAQPPAHLHPPTRRTRRPSRGRPDLRERSHQLALICDDITATAEELRDKGLEVRGQPEDEGWGITTTLVLPGGFEVMLYQPRHPTAI